MILIGGVCDMANVTLDTQMLQRHDIANNWTLKNPVLGNGEIGVETDTNLFKIGDGVNNWANLKYANGGVKDGNTGNNMSFWTGTQSEYDAITTKNPDTFYFVKD